MGLGFRVLGFGVRGVEFCVHGLGFGVQGAEFGDQGLGLNPLVTGPIDTVRLTPSGTLGHFSQLQPTTYAILGYRV